MHTNTITISYKQCYYYKSNTASSSTCSMYPLSSLLEMQDFLHSAETSCFLERHFFLDLVGRSKKKGSAFSEFELGCSMLMFTKVNVDAEKLKFG